MLHGIKKLAEPFFLGEAHPSVTVSRFLDTH